MTEDLLTSAKKGKATELSHKIAETLVEQREHFKMSQRDFADRIGVSFQQYQKYEKGKDRLSLERALLLCRHLGLSLNVFMDGDAGAAYGFAESEQSAFGSASPSAAEKELLEIYAGIPKKNKENFLAAVRQLAKMA